MARLENEYQYNAVMERVDKLFFETNEDTLPNDPRLVELDILSELIEEYEKEHFPIKAPTLSETLSSRMADLHYTQKELAELLEMSAPRLCDIINGKKNPTYEQARTIAIKLQVDPSIVLAI